MTVVALVLLLALGVAGLALWSRAGAGGDARAWAVVSVAVAAVCAAGWFAIEAPPAGPGLRELAIGLSFVASVGAGGPVADAVLRLADSATQAAAAPDPTASAPSAAAPAGPPLAGPPAVDPAAAAGPADPSVLRGGPWIGVLERLGVTATLLFGFDQGLALLLAVKGLGRYPELTNPGSSRAAAERFIVGTFASGLWAAACAGVGVALLR